MSDLNPDQRPDGWDAAHATYEKVFESFTTLIAGEMVQTLGVDSDHRVLDVGAGTGALTFVASPHAREVLAVDFAPKMVARIVSKAEIEGADNVTARIMDGQELDLEPDEFDRAFANLSTIFFPEPNKGLRELQRVLKPGGRAAVSAWSNPAKIDILVALVSALTRSFPDFPRPSPVWLCFQDPKVFRDAMLEAGFKKVDVVTRSRAWVVPSADWLCAHIGGFSPGIAALFAHLGESGVEKVVGELREDLVSRFGQGELSLPSEYHVAVGTA